MFPKDLKNQNLLTAFNVTSPTEGIGTLLNKTKCYLVAVYDATVNGGAAGTYSLNDDLGAPALLPQGAIVTNVVANVITQPTASGGAATVSLGSGIASAVDDLLAATAKTDLGVGFVAGAPVGTSATWIGPVTAASSRVVAAVATHTLQAGKIYFNIEYVINALT